MSSSERAFVAGWTALVLALAAIPAVHGYASAPPGSRFAGFVGAFHNDYDSYLAWIRQAYDGHSTFRILYTTEPHARWFFHPLFWAMGALARGTGLSLLAVWHLAQAAGCIALVAAVHGFLVRCTPSRSVRLLALVLTMTASGFGWIWIRAAAPAAGRAFEHTPIDLWMAEASPFPALVTSFFTLPIALALLLGALNRTIDFVDRGRFRDALLGGLFALGLAAIHPYDMLTLDAVLIAWLGISGWRHWKGFAIVMGAALPYLVYAVGVTRFAPVFSEVTWAMPMPSLPALLWGGGLPLALCGGALLDPRVRRENPRLALPAAWLAVTVLLLLAPIGFGRKLIWGAMVPICLLGAMGLASWGRALLGRVAHRPARIAIGVCASVLVIMIAAAGSVDFYARLMTRNREARLGDYLPPGILEAMQWLETHAAPAQVVLATPAIAPWLPGRTGVTVFEGHWAQTLDQARKRAFVLDLFSAQPHASPEQVRRILERNRVRYIVADRSSLRAYRLSGSEADYPFRPWARPVFANAEVSIWEVIGYRPAPEDVPWGKGESWRG